MPSARRIAAEVSQHLEYLTRVAAELDAPEPVHERFEEAVGRVDALREAARVWHRTADRVEKSAQGVAGKLGGIDKSWQGADADAFLAHMRETGLAGNDIVDAMRALAEALDHTADAVEALVEDIGQTVTDTADAVSQALVVPVDGEQRARRHLEDLEGPAGELFSAVEDVFGAFARFCDELQSGREIGELQFDKRMPAQNWQSSVPEPPAPPAAAPAPPAPAAPEGAGAGAGGGTGGGGASAAGAASAAGGVGGGAPDLSPGGSSGAAEPSATPPAVAASAGAAAGGAAAAAGGGMAGGMMPMGMMGGAMGAQGGAQERQNKSRLKSSSEELFGAPQSAPPAVYGEDPDNAKQSEDKPAKPKPLPKPPMPPKRGSAGVGDAPPPKI
ncbi:WXG100 family type VII secretion target [Saccharopolyspora erythraea NRRL 2338]|uniref:Endo-1,4-beta-glucanase n=4 Tax=Saccharopolyspora erythraea TaxID=1836 RepID=A4FPI4_SACEN|nr:WXG100 family type VII secretion target [Saccharopolyspora erythraea]PFG99604.1 WXG100 family type VII secretion target [Saccharopolyspora erythraea NRRL 2338]QRK89494.1 WXG100 family type VII secretion target [Saccharopolyspora erythraea]CAM05959.1 endo-1,4-beta-glucanase [Saccharopolyspora erythraea NRRL 2338]